MKWFLKGLPEWYRRKVIISIKFRFKDKDVPEEAFKDYYNKVIVLLGRVKVIANFKEAREYIIRAIELVKVYYKVI